MFSYTSETNIASFAITVYLFICKKFQTISESKMGL